MVSISRIDQAVLLLRDRLERLKERSASASGSATRQVGSGKLDPFVPLRQLMREGRIGPDELRKAFVRTLLANALGENVAESLEFQSISDQVLRILEDNEAGRDLITRALAELE